MRRMPASVRRMLLGLALLLPAGIVPARAGGSTYSRYGFGDLLFFGSDRTYAMGGLGIGLVSDGFINRFNPAALSRISLTRFAGGFEYSDISSQSSEGSSAYAKGSAQGAVIAFPVSTSQGIVLSLEETPYSTVSYGVQEADSEAGINSVQNFYGSGGLSVLALGGSWIPLSHINVGVKANYIFGHTRQYINTHFDDPTYTDAQIDRDAYLSGATFTGGIILDSLGEVLGIPFLRTLSIGAVATSSTTLLVHETRYYSSVDTTIADDGDTGLPLSLGLGLSYLANGRYQFIADVYGQQWSAVKYFGAAMPQVRNNLRASAGVEIIPDKDADTYARRIVYRAGAFYHSTYFDINGQGINEFFVAAGVGLPVAVDSHLNIGLQLGTRGSTANGLQRDTLFRLSLSISGSEAWFLEYKEE